MNCPHCNGKTYILDSRRDVDTVRRRRECLECKSRFSTVEIDVDYYKSLQPIDGKSIRKALRDSVTENVRELMDNVRRILDEHKQEIQQ